MGAQPDLSSRRSGEQQEPASLHFACAHPWYLPNPTALLRKVGRPFWDRSDINLIYLLNSGPSLKCWVSHLILKTQEENGPGSGRKWTCCYKVGKVEGTSGTGMASVEGAGCQGQETVPVLHLQDQCALKH